MNTLGIDGGGSKTTFLLVDAADRELARHESGPSNWVSVGKDAARRAIAEGIQQVGDRADVVCAGFAGAGRPEGRAFYVETLRRLLPRSRTIVETDGLIAYIGALGLEPGVLLIAGTGSIAIGRRADGTVIRVGGWGPHFGDAGSGFWIGREAIRAALASLDLGRPDEFVERIAQALGLKTIADVVGARQSEIVGIPEVAALFSTVVAYYPKEPARRILGEAATHLRYLAETAAMRVDVENCRKAMSGSVISHPVMRNLAGIPLEDPQHPPEWGAIFWARHEHPNP